MKACPFCAEDIQDAAIVCKHCGRDLVKSAEAPIAATAAVPRKQRTSVGTGCLAVILLTLGVGFCASLFSGSDRTTAPATGTPAPAAQAKDDPACRTDLKCWAQKHMSTAEVMCPRVIERFAKNNFEWTDGFLDRKFTHYRWKGKPGGDVTYIGDKIKFQNGFGAWIFHTYECDINEQGAILDARVKQGRLQ